MRRIAFFGGTFDPPHRGHLAIAKSAADRFALDSVLFAPVTRQPLKETAPSASFLHRYAMTALATEADPRFIPSLVDAPSESGSNDRPNYTVETLKRLRGTLQASAHPFQLFTLLGADSWQTIARWHDPLRLLSLSDWIVASRPGICLSEIEVALPKGITAESERDSCGCALVLRHAGGGTTRVHLLDNLHEDVSATELRTGLQSGKLLSGMLPAAVAEYIAKTNLYR